MGRRLSLLGGIRSFRKRETTEGIRKRAFLFTPGLYVGAERVEDDGEPLTEKYPRLLAELGACFAEGERLMGAVRERLAEVNPNV